MEKISNNKKGILLMLISSICVCIGQLLWKLAVDYGALVLLAGFIFYGIGALIMILAYKYGKLSVLQPMLSLNYVLSIILGYFVLHEKMSIFNCFGILIIILGVFFIAGEKK